MDSLRVPQVHWELDQVSSPHLDHPVSVVVARDIAYLSNCNRLQNLSLYLPSIPATLMLVGLPPARLPSLRAQSRLPETVVHIHGGAWRDPMLGAKSVEAAVAHAFSEFDEASTTTSVASLNYSLAQFPTHPSDPYDATKDHPRDPAREAVHPQPLHDVFLGLALLRSLGVGDQSYILSGHSCGSCLALQSAMQSPEDYGLVNVDQPPVPAAVVGLNGLYDLPALVHGLGPSHELLRSDYKMMLTNAFGDNEDAWRSASPAHFDAARIAERVGKGHSPRLVLADQSIEDQLVPTNQRERLEQNLRKVDGLSVITGKRCTGKHAAPWQQGSMIWASICDVLDVLKSA